VATHAWQANPVLVTGAAGFAGSHLLELLSASSVNIVAWRRPGGSPPSIPVHAAWEAVDLLDRDATAAAIDRLRPAAVYHCAGAAHVGRAWNTTEATLAGNVRATHHLLEALRRARVACRVLIPSSAMLYRAADRPLTEHDEVLPSNPYGLSKLAQELLALKSLGDGIDIHIARPFNHVGPRQDPWFVASGFAQRIADIEAGRWAPEIAVGNLDARRDLTDVRDTVRGYQLIMERGRSGRIYNICSGRAVAIRDLLDMLLARARVPIKIVVDPSRLRPNDAAQLLGDCARIRSELGWTPTITLEETLDDLLAYWRTREQ
jgi:GDP-4-dehydro-6-deoxy-D-mannose reductase